MWKISDLQEGKRYRVALVEREDGDRNLYLLEEGALTEVPRTMFVTDYVPYELLRRRCVTTISETVSLVGGGRFYVDAHGVWLTSDEVNAMDSGARLSEVPWLNGICPQFLPK